MGASGGGEDNAQRHRSLALASNDATSFLLRSSYRLSSLLLSSLFFLAFDTRRYPIRRVKCAKGVRALSKSKRQRENRRDEGGKEGPGGEKGAKEARMEDGTVKSSEKGGWQGREGGEGVRAKQARGDR